MDITKEVFVGSAKAPEASQTNPNGASGADTLSPRQAALDATRAGEDMRQRLRDVLHAVSRRPGTKPPGPTAR